MRLQCGPSRRQGGVVRNTLGMETENQRSTGVTVALTHFVRVALANPRSRSASATARQRKLKHQFLVTPSRHVRREPQRDRDGQDQVVLGADTRIVGRPTYRVGDLSLEVFNSSCNAPASQSAWRSEVRPCVSSPSSTYPLLSTTSQLSVIGT